MKSFIFWDIPPCSPLKVDIHFWGTCWTHFQGSSISQARNQRESIWQTEGRTVHNTNPTQCSRGHNSSKTSNNNFGSDFHMMSHRVLALLMLKTWRWRRYIHPKHHLTFNELHGIISQKIGLFMLGNVTQGSDLNRLFIDVSKSVLYSG
jgi:hypothetical protein